MNIFCSEESHQAALDAQTGTIKARVAKELTCGDIALKPEEISVRFIASSGSGMIAPIEVEVTAHAFAERVDNQDEISVRIRSFLMELLPGQDIRVWLMLPQLGHSWE